MGHHTPAARWGGQRRFRRACPKGSRGRAKRGEGTMDSEQGPPASSASSTGTTASSTSTSSSSSAGRQAVPQISVYSGIPDRQTVQVNFRVIQQALHRQPNTAAQYLQQMYAAQQQHLMLQTAALQQQQHLSNAQLQSLAVVQQASIAAGRQSSTQNGTSSQHTGSSQTTINLTTSPAAAQLISRAQSVSSAPAGSISQQAVILGSTSSPTTLTASQAHMYLRAQMAQQSNLVEVARSLGRAVPLSSQLIFTPTATVAAVQSETSTQSSGQQHASSQVQNLAIRSQQGATTSSFQTHSLQALSLKQSPVSIQPSPLIKNPSQGSQGAGGKGSWPDGLLDGSKKGGSIVTEVRAINMSRSVTAVSGQPLITPAYTQIQPHSLVQQHKQQQFVIQQTQASQRTQGQLLQTASIQPHLQTPSLVPHSPSQPGPIPVLPKPASHHQPSTPSQQATIFHSTISPHALHSTLSQAKAQPVQLTAINLQIQPAPSQASRLVQDSKGQDKPTSSVVRERCPTPSVQQQSTPSNPSPPQATKPTAQPKTDPVTPISQPQGVTTTNRVNAAPGTAPPAMTSGIENEAPTLTGSIPQNGENKPPQAIVKPQVLTHVIEGFVIQEGAEPFPIERLPVMMDSPKKLHEQLSSDPDKTPVSNPTNTTDSETEELTPQELKDQEDSDSPKLSCEFCGWVDFAYKFKGSKRFCSMVCAKRYNVGCRKRIGLFHPARSKTSNRWHRSHNSGHQSIEPKKQKLSPMPQQTQGDSVPYPLPSQPSQEDSSPCSDMSSYEEPPSPLSEASSGPPAPQAVSHMAGRGSDQEAPRSRELPLLTQHFLPNNPTKWNVEEVYEFIRSLPGCQEIADEFRSQEIDGQAMLLLKEDHLMSAMNIKLGPALKIYASINILKDS
ncbi:polyhomeotic-like protein 2 isoform X2 [Coregonus clupeaformis]|uniref:polyhomeotic-like protein 2 isoform X2 n=1 Tax=Coregonus clupeaformis TaxID=59861 RepID=UPI001BDF9D88|nr:polyhomeotic-like protein 2 isoform X2 [Coregonus clupeaformis]